MRYTLNNSTPTSTNGTLIAGTSGTVTIQAGTAKTLMVGPGPTARYEHYGYGSVNKADSHDWITYGPYKGKKGQVSGMNTSDFLRADASPDGYRRVFSVYTHVNWRRDVDAGDRMGFAGMAGSPRVYLATPPMPGSSAPEPNVLVWH